MKHLQSRLVPFAGLFLLGLSSLAQAQGFNSSKNPNGAYSYGYEAKNAGSLNPVGGSFTLFKTYTEIYKPDDSNVALHEFSQSTGSLPAIFYNNNATTFIQHGGSTATIEAHQLALHPDSNGDYSVLRFTVQTTGLYNVSAMFNAADNTPTTTDVHVLLGNSGVYTNLFTGEINNQNGMVGGNANYTPRPLALVTGETVDFAVGYGSNGTYYSDTTGLFASVTPVPELSTFLGFGSFVVFGGLAAFRQRKQARQAA